MALIPVEVISQNEECNYFQPSAAHLSASVARVGRDGLSRCFTALLAKRKSGWLLALAVLLAWCANAAAQGVFSTPQPVGVATSDLSVTVTAQAAGSVATVEVLTMGAPNLDFTVGGTGSTCPTAVMSVGTNPSTCKEAVVFKPTAPGVRLGAVVLLDSSKNVLATTYLSGTGLGGLGVLNSGNVLAMAGVYRKFTSTQDNIPATQANLNQPASIVLDGAGNMYIADSTHNKIRMVTAPVAPAAVGVISTYAGTGAANYLGDNGKATKATLDTPSGVAMDGAGNLYIADSNNNVIRKITPSTGVITTVAGTGTGGYSGDNAAATLAELNLPKGITVDASGNLYIADTDNQRIRKVDAATGIITTIAGDGTLSGKADGKGTYTGDGGAAGSAGLSLPYTVAFDTAGNMYIPDSANNVIRMVAATNGAITAASKISTVVGFTPGNPGNFGDGGLATAALLNSPFAVAVDAAGNIYVADTQNARIRKVNAASGIINSLIINGTGSTLAPGATTPSAVQIFAPIGLFLDGAGNLYFADFYYMLVEEIKSNQSILNFTQNTVQVGSQSAVQVQKVENDGNAPLDLTAFTPDSNAAVDPGTTTCPLAPPTTTYLAEDADCNIGAIFAPALALVFPAGATSLQVDGNVDVEGNTESFSTDLANTPLDIELVGVATPVNATTLVLTSNPASPSNYGHAVTFTATVTSGATSGTPVGNVEFTDTFNGVTTTLSASVGVNASGIAVFTTITPLAVGTHLITANFTGLTTSNFLPSTGTLTQVVGEVTKTTVTSSGSPSAANASVTFTATITAPAGGGVVLDGTVIFTDTPTGGTATQLGTTQTITASGMATVATATLTSGLHTITAVYSGDVANGIIGSPGSFIQDVQSPSTVGLTSSLSPSVYGQPVTFTVTVPNIGSIPATGSAQILVQGQATPWATVALTGSPASGQFTTSALAVGTYTLTATFPGDNYYSSSTSTAITQVVTQVGTTTTVNAVPAMGIAGAPVAITVVVKPTQGVATPSGTVTFTDAVNGGAVGPLGGTVKLVGGTVTINPLLAPGSHAIVATYSGDANDATSSGNLALTVNQAVTNTVVTSSGSPSLVLAPVTFTATVTSVGGGIPQGNVTFTATSSGGTSAPLGCAGTLTAAGVATCTTSSLVAGTYTIMATYNGDTNDATSTGTVSQVVGTIPTVTDLGASSTGGTTPQVILVAAVLNSAAANAGSLPIPTGTVVFMNGAAQVGSAAVDPSGVATFQPSLPTGTYNIVAVYSGDKDHSPSTSAVVPISTTASDFNLKVTPNSVSIPSTENATVSVTLTSADGFADTIGLGCASLPAGVNCHFSTPSAALAANGVVVVSLSIDTNNPLGGGTSMLNARPVKGGQRLVLTAGLLLPLGVLFGGIFWRFRRRYARSMTVALVLLLSGAVLMATGCSGSFSQSSATPGTYKIQVTGTGANSNISHYENVTLIITAK
jgi:sugar lactone lactonase YvrE